MISIIASSYKEDIFLQFKDSIEKTIGDTPYEIIRIYNPNVMSLSAAYNRGGEAAQFPFLLFCHEDILFHTKQWGRILVEVFDKDPAIGLVGIAGSYYKALFYSGWFIQNSSSSTFMIGSHYGTSNLKKIKNGINEQIVLYDKKSIPKLFIDPEIVNEEVAVLDGMLLGTTKEIFSKIKFDDALFTGFHCYDLDYSLQMRGKYKVVVNQNILIEHLSAGYFASDWIKYIKVFSEKWINHLPASSKTFSAKEKAAFEWSAFEQYLRINKKNKKEIVKGALFIYQPTYIKRMRIACWMMIQQHLLRRLIRNKGELK